MCIWSVTSLCYAIGVIKIACPVCPETPQGDLVKPYSLLPPLPQPPPPRAKLKFMWCGMCFMTPPACIVIIYAHTRALNNNNVDGPQYTARQHEQVSVIFPCPGQVWNVKFLVRGGQSSFHIQPNLKSKILGEGGSVIFPCPGQIWNVNFWWGGSVISPYPAKSEI